MPAVSSGSPVLPIGAVQALRPAPARWRAILAPALAPSMLVPPITSSATLPIPHCLLILPALALPAPPAAAQLLAFAFLGSSTLEVKVRKMNLFSLDAMLHDAIDTVMPGTDAVLRLQVLNDLVWISNVILLKAEPQGVFIWWPVLLCRSDDGGDAFCREAVMRQVHFLNGTTFRYELRQGLGACVVYVVLVESQHLEFLALEA